MSIGKKISALMTQRSGTCRILTCGLFFDRQVTLCGAFIVNFFDSKGYNFDQIIQTVAEDDGNRYEDLQMTRKKSTLTQTRF